MKKVTFLLLIVFCLIGISYGQMKMTPALTKATQNRRPDEKISILITMAQQYDATGIEQKTQFMSRKTRTQFVVEELKQFSQESQADLIRFLMAEPNKVSDITPFWIFNGIGCKTTAAMAEVIAQRNDVKIVDVDDVYQTPTVQITEDAEDNTRDLPWNINQIHAEQVWNYNGSTGYTGNNIVIAILDSGINYIHPNLENHMWDGGSDYPNHGINYCVVNTSALYKDPIDNLEYGSGHGTMVAGIIAGDNTGIAKGAKLMAIKIADSDGYVTEARINNGLQFALDNGADIVLITACEDGVGGRASYRDKMISLLNAGVVAVTSAGDKGQDIAAPLSISSPSNCPSPWHNPDESSNGGRSANICVGATDIHDMKWISSSIGPVTWSGVTGYNDYPYNAGNTTQTGLIRPDVTAPGTNIQTTSYHVTIDQNTGEISGGNVIANGTILSAAHVAAVAALMLEADPSLTPTSIDRILETTAVKCEGTLIKNNYYGAGRIDAFEAVQAVKATINPPTNVTANANGNIVTLTWTAASSAVSYDIYCNEERIAQGVTGTTYTDRTTFSGSHLYYIKSNRSNGSQSAKSAYAKVVVDPIGPLATNLSASLNNHNVSVSWEAPVPPTVMRFGTAETNSDTYGISGSVLYWAQRFLPSFLEDYAGCTIDSICLYFIKSGTYDVYLYDGNPNGVNQELFHTQVTPSQLKCWTQIAVNPGIAIDHTKDLWLVAKAPKSITNPATACKIINQPSSYASLKSSDKKNWTLYNEKRAWMMKLILSTSEYTYNVRHNGTELAHGLTDLSYTHNNVPAGVHYYSITTNYGNDNYVSFPSDSVRVNIDTRFTVTFDPGNGSCSTSSLQQTALNGPVTLPTASPSASCQAEGYTFAGWSTEIIDGETEQPELMLAGSQYVPTDDITLYAVYKNIQGQQGWYLARTVNVGDSIRIVCPDYNIQLGNFTVGQHQDGYTLRNQNGLYLYRTYNLLDYTSIQDLAVWSIEMVNGIAIVRNSDQQLMAVNPTTFACTYYLEPQQVQYKNIQFYRYTTSSYCSYDHTPNCGSTLQPPTILPYADGVYLDPVTVTMSSTASGASIYYTTNGDEPTTNSSLYVTNPPLVISTTKTVKARAYKSGFTQSTVATMTYDFAKEYASISAFKSSANTTEIAKITSNMRVTHQYHRHLYVSDNTGGLLIYDDYNLLSETFIDGDYIGNVFGRYQVVDGQVMLVLMHDIEKTGTNEPVAPTIKTIQQVNSSYNTYDAQLMLFQGVKFTESQDAFNSAPMTIVKNDKQLATRDKFGTVNCPIDAESTYDVIGLMGMEGTLKIVYPRSNNDIRKYYSVTCETPENGNLTTNNATAAAHSTVTVTATPNNGYHILSLYYYGSNPDEPIDIDLNELSFEMPEEDVTVVAVFEMDVLYTVSFNPGSGTCNTTSLTETSWASGIILPDASPSANCAAEGYVFQGWTDHFVTETMAMPQLFTPGSTYYPTDHQTLYAVYSIEGSDWHDVTNMNDFIQGNYVIYTKYNNNYYFLFQDGAGTNLKAKRMIFKNGLPSAPALANYNPLEHLWTIEAIDGNRYSITYTDGNTTYYLKAYRDNANNGISVTTTNPNEGWEFTNNTIAGSKKGLLARFPTPVPDKAVRYLDIDSNASTWLYHDRYGYLGELYLFLSPSNIYSTNPECQLPVETPEFVDLPEGDITENDYTVTITCGTPDASIYYTTNGDEPDNSSTLYTGPFIISDDCTVKAIAYNGAGDHSYVTSHDFTFITRYASIAEFKASAPSNIVVRISCDVTCVYQHEGYLYVYDGTTGLLVRDLNGVITNTYANGDVIQGGLLGKYRKTDEQVMMIPTANPAEGIAGTPVEPEVVNIYTLYNNYSAYDARLITLTDASFSANYDLSNPNASFTVAQAQGGNSMNVINQFGTLGMTGNANDHFDITGFVGRDNTFIKHIYPRDDDDFVPYYNIVCDDAILHGSVSASPDHARANDQVTLTATPQNGWTLEQWTVTAQGSSVNVNNNSFTMPASSVYVSATFTALEYTVTVEVSPAEGGTASIDQEGPFLYGESVTANAEPNNGYTFKYWLKNGEIDVYNAHATFVVTEDMVLTAVFEETENYHITLSADPAEGGSVSGTGYYFQYQSVTVKATPNPGWEFINWTENDEEVSTNATFSFAASADRHLVAHFEQNGAAQTMNLVPGWTWFSSYIECSDDVLDQLKNGIAATSNSAQIKSQYDGFITLSGNNWGGNLNNFCNEQMYLLKTEGGSVTLIGDPAIPTNHPITLNPGWNWIGFPSMNDMTLETALSALTPNNGDVIKSQYSYSTYSTTAGWSNGLPDMEAGKGYLYWNKGTQPMTLTYPNSTKEVVDKTPQPKYWTANYSDFATNLSMMVTLDENEFGLSEGGYEIGAFVNGECRGSARLQLFDGHYVAFLPVSGNEGEEVNFQLYDVNTDEIFATNAAERISYMADAIIGTVESPMVLHFRNTGLESLQASTSVFPNPAKDQVTICCDDMMQVSIVSLVGQTLRQENISANQVQLSINDLDSGLYLLHIIKIDGSVITKKLEIQR